jgi:type VI protein secretion system component VasK
MSRLNLKWWQWLLIGTGFCAVAIITGPMADRYGYATFAGLMVSILAWTAFSICWVLGFVRFVKWVWSIRSSNRTRVSSTR